jgi:eukaryotic-like serine/threonine-protein kinase
VINQLVNQRYEVVEKLGDSPLFAVFKARDQAQSRIVAVKTVLDPYATDETFVRDLKASLEAVAALKQPNIGQFYEFGLEAGTPYAVVEYVRGINLKERVRRIAPFSLSVAIDYACAMAEALHFAHLAGHPHGDLRPQNVIISPEGAVKITDFGVQPAVARCPRALTEVAPRFMHYKAPELTFAQPGTPQGDLYALGAILYEMLTGTMPYAGDAPDRIAQDHATAAIPSPRAINPGVPRSVEGVIVKALQKQTTERYQNAAEMLNDLKSVRDALRFGKPLSWTPIDIEKAAAAVAPPPAPAAQVAAEGPPPIRKPVRPLEPVAEVAASSRPAAGSASNRLRHDDDTVSLILKVLIAVATGIIFFCLIGFAGIWMTRWVVPKQAAVPELSGKTIDEVRAFAKTMKVALREHADYMDRPRNIVYRTDPSRGDQLRIGHVLNVWYSKGPVYSDVPNLVNLQRDDAEQKLKDAGLTMGKVTLEYSAKAPRDSVISQDVSPKKRVMHDTAVDILVSDGPKPDYSDSTGLSSDGSTSASPDASAPATSDPADLQTHVFDRSVTIKNDGLGVRQVRIEYVDADGEHTPVIDEPHKEGDRVPLHFEYRGKKITLRAFYNDEKKWELPDLDPEATKHQRIDNPGSVR